MLAYNEEGCIHWEAAGLLCPLTPARMRHASLVNIHNIPWCERARARSYRTEHINNSRRLISEKISQKEGRRRTRKKKNNNWSITRQQMDRSWFNTTRVAAVLVDSFDQSKMTDVFVFLKQKVKRAQH